jgi:hypothetical protein
MRRRLTENSPGQIVSFLGDRQVRPVRVTVTVTRDDKTIEQFLHEEESSRVTTGYPEVFGFT